VTQIVRLVMQITFLHVLFALKHSLPIPIPKESAMLAQIQHVDNVMLQINLIVVYVRKGTLYPLINVRLALQIALPAYSLIQI